MSQPASLQSPIPSSIPSRGATCTRHPEFGAAITCQRCGQFACDVCRTPSIDGLELCPDCAARNGGGLALAGLSERFMAAMADGLTLLPGYVLLILDGALESPMGGILIAAGSVYMLAVLLLQLRHVRRGQSIGKRWQAIRVVRMDGSIPSMSRIILLRNIAVGVLGMIPLFSLIDILFILGEKRRCLHDLLADTRVVSGQPDAA